MQTHPSLKAASAAYMNYLVICYRVTTKDSKGVPGWIKNVRPDYEQEQIKVTCRKGRMREGTLFVTKESVLKRRLFCGYKVNIQ